MTADEFTCAHHSDLLQDWLALCQQRGFQIRSIQLQSVDFKGKDTYRRPLFIKLKADASDEEGRPLPGVCVLRGHAVAVLPMLHCEGEDYALLVRQARLPAALTDCLEIPAGMCEGEIDPTAVAVRELEEETGLLCAPHELKDLLPGVGWIDATPGLVDEGVRLFLLERNIPASELEDLRSRTCGKADENEYIELELLKVEDILTKSNDAKTLLATALYLARRNSL
jgi:ADP-sugar diphosphatase